MSKEEQPSQHREEQPFWTADIALYEGRFRHYRGQPVPVRASVHVGEEQYRPGDVRREIVPLAHQAGERSYVLLKPYVPEPNQMLTVGLYSHATPDGAIGEVMSATTAGTRQREIGHAQAWHYPLDRTLVLWECYLNPPFRDRPLPEDVNMARLWTATERWLLERFPATTRIVTTARDPLFGDAEYQRFLTERGYEPVTTAYARKVTRPA